MIAAVHTWQTRQVVTAVTSQGAAVPAALFAAPSGNKGDALPDMMDSWDTKESSMIGARLALVGRTLPDMGRAPADPGRGGLPADAGRDALGLQPTVLPSKHCFISGLFSS